MNTYIWQYTNGFDSVVVVTIAPNLEAARNQALAYTGAEIDAYYAATIQAMRLTHLMGNLQDAIRREILSDASAIVRFYTEEEQ